MSKNTYNTLSVIWAFLIIFFSLMPAAGPPLPYIDKIMHFATYYILAFFLVRSSFKNSELIWQILVFGVVIEIFQFYTGRVFSFWDIFFNTLGAWIGLHISYHSLKKLGVKI